MIAGSFYSPSRKCKINIVLTKEVCIISECYTSNFTIMFPRDKAFHFNEDGLQRAFDTFEDPRFYSWYEDTITYISNNE